MVSLDVHRLSVSGVNKCRLRRIFLLIAPLASAWVMPAAHAELVIEPVFNRVEGTGGAENVVGVRQAVNGIQESLGIEPLWGGQPNEIFSYVTGDPRKLELDELFFYNDTGNEINGFSLRIIGTGTDTDDPRTIVRGPIDARFGDVDGDGQLLSDLFPVYEISPDGKTIEFSGGSIAPGERFTDIHLARSDNAPELAGLDSWITVVPEPSGNVLIVASILPVLLQSRRFSRTPHRY